MQQTRCLQPAAAHLHPGAHPVPYHRPSTQAFFSSATSRAAFPAQPAVLPPGALPLADQVRIRDRATILGRQLYAEQGAGFADGQVAALLAALHIDAAALPGGLSHVHDADWHGIWRQQRQQQPGGPGVAADVAAAAHAANMEAAWREQQAARPWCKGEGRGWEKGLFDRD